MYNACSHEGQSCKQSRVASTEKQKSVDVILLVFTSHVMICSKCMIFGTFINLILTITLDLFIQLLSANYLQQRRVHDLPYSLLF